MEQPKISQADKFKREMAPSLVRRQDNIPRDEHLKMLLVGKPKSAGKTTFALSAPGTKLVLSYDLGLVPKVPGVSEEEIYIVQYPVAQTEVLPQTDRWKRPANVGSRIIVDVEEIRNAFLQQRPIQFGDEEVPLPSVIIIDGMTELQSIALDWVLAVNQMYSPEDFSNRYAAWGKRLDFMRNLVNMLIPLPAHVIITAWESKEEVPVPGGRPGETQPTGRFLPDIGGKLDNALSGKVDVVLRCYAEYQGDRAQYWVQCQPDAQREYVGVRGRYNLPKKINVTLSGREGEPLPFARVMGEVA